MTKYQYLSQYQYQYPEFTWMKSNIFCVNEPSSVNFYWRVLIVYVVIKKVCLEQNISIGSFHASFHNFLCTWNDDKSL